MRLLLSCDAPWSPSGYGVQAQGFLPRLARLPEIGGLDHVAVSTIYGLQGGILTMGGLRLYPHGGGDHGNTTIGLHAQHFKADVVVTLIDAWTQRETAAKVAPARWAAWLPIDSEPAPQRTVDALHGATPLVYSRWGTEQLARAGVPARYVPLGIEPAVFRPLADTARRAEIRAGLAGPDCTHLAVMVAANVSGGVGGADRKAFPQQMRAWARFAADKPGARLYLHADPLTHYGGLDLAALARDLGIAERVHFADSYQYFLGYPAAYVAAVYQAADVLLAASMAEGFGLPLVEAQACGCPVVTTAFASMPELVRWGIAVPPRDRYWAGGLNAWWAWPDVDGIADALGTLFDEGPQPDRARFASETIHAEYGWDTVVRDYWGPLVREWV